MLFRKTILSDILLGIWEISESLEELCAKTILSHEEASALTKIKNENKKKQWLCTRLLLKTLTEGDTKIVYTENGKPYFKNSQYKISISHTSRYVAIIMDFFETGIDIQHMDPKIERIVHKFMSETEIKSLKKENKLEQLFIYWCAKESLYKLYGNKNVLFNKHLFIEPFQYEGTGQITGNIKIHGMGKKYVMKYEKLAEDNMLVYILNK